MALSIGQFSWHGLTLGPGTDFPIKGVKGLRTNPPQRITKVSRSQQDGAVPQWSYLDSRIVTLTTMIAPNAASLEADIEALLTAFVATDDPANLIALEFLLSSGWPNYRQVVGRCTSDDLDYDVLAEASIAAQWFPIEITCDDPLAYDTQTADHDQNTANFSTTFGAGNISTTLTCDNVGNWRVDPLITVTAVGGVAGTDGILWVDGVDVMHWDQTMGSTAPWVFDSLNTKVTDTNGNSQIGSLVPGYSWPVFTPGTHTVACSGSIGTGHKLEVVFSPGWAAV